jgi:hypothetical protein
LRIDTCEPGTGYDIERDYINDNPIDPGISNAPGWQRTTDVRRKADPAQQCEEADKHAPLHTQQGRAHSGAVGADGNGVSGAPETSYGRVRCEPPLAGMIC